MSNAPKQTFKNGMTAMDRAVIQSALDILGRVSTLKDSRDLSLAVVGSSALAAKASLTAFKHDSEVY